MARTCLVHGVLACLAISFFVAQGLELESGRRYTIQLNKSTYCSSTDQYLGFTNRTCSAGIQNGGYNGPTVGPVLRSGTGTSFKQWVVTIKRKEGNNYIVSLSNYYDKSKGTIRCYGDLVVEKSGLCDSGSLVDRVRVHKHRKDEWILAPSGTNQFNIISVVRSKPSNCLAYLGVSNNCSDPSLRLYAAEGAQSWTFRPLGSSPSPASPSPPVDQKIPPGKPSNVTVTFSIGSARTSKKTAARASNMVATLQWKDGSEGKPVETYTCRCVFVGSGCSGTPQGNSPSGIPRGAGKCQVTGLDASKAYDCFVVAENTAADVCSGTGVATLTAPGKPNQVSGVATLTSVYITWTDGSVGNPVETYSIKCVYPGASCSDFPAFGYGNIDLARGTQQASLDFLDSGTRYSCFVVAHNSVGQTCSDPIDVQTLEDAVPPPPPVPVLRDYALIYDVQQFGPNDATLNACKVKKGVSAANTFVNCTNIANDMLPKFVTQYSVARFGERLVAFAVNPYYEIPRGRSATVNTVKEPVVNPFGGRSATARDGSITVPGSVSVCDIKITNYNIEALENCTQTYASTDFLPFSIEIDNDVAYIAGTSGYIFAKYAACKVKSGPASSTSLYDCVEHQPGTNGLLIDVHLKDGIMYNSYATSLNGQPGMYECKTNTSTPFEACTLTFNPLAGLGLESAIMTLTNDKAFFYTEDYKIAACKFNPGVMGPQGFSGCVVAHTPAIQDGYFARLNTFDGKFYYRCDSIIGGGGPEVPKCYKACKIESTVSASVISDCEKVWFGYVPFDIEFFQTYSV